MLYDPTNPDWVPSLKLGYSTGKASTSGVERHERTARHTTKKLQLELESQAEMQSQGGGSGPTTSAGAPPAAADGSDASDNTEMNQVQMVSMQWAMQQIISFARFRTIRCCEMSCVPNLELRYLAVNWQLGLLGQRSGLVLSDQW